MSPKKTGTWAKVRFEAGNYMQASTEYTHKSEEVDKMRLALIEPRRELEEHNEEISRCTLEMAKHSKKFSHYFEQRLAAAAAARARILTMIEDFERAEEAMNVLQEQHIESRNELWKAMDNLNRKNIVKLKNMADYIALKEFPSRGGDPIKFSIATSTSSYESLELQRKLRELLNRAGIADLRGWDVYQINNRGEITRLDR